MGDHWAVEHWVPEAHQRKDVRMHQATTESIFSKFMQNTKAQYWTTLRNSNQTSDKATQQNSPLCNGGLGSTAAIWR